jgi:hypothetical protein
LVVAKKTNKSVARLNTVVWSMISVYFALSLMKFMII